MYGPNECELHPRKICISNVKNLANSWKSGYSELCERKLIFCIISGRWGKALIRALWQVSECHGWVFVMGVPSQNVYVLWK